MSLHRTKRRLDYVESVVVTCPNALCEKQTTVQVRQRNDAKFAGIWCDGEYGARHVVCPMIGPEGERWA